MKKRQEKFIVLGNLPDDVYMTDRRGYTFIADRVGEPEKAQQLCRLLNQAFRAERARVRRLVRTVRRKSKYLGFIGIGYRRACDDILATLKEGR